jgi:hypothetical protein
VAERRSVVSNVTTPGAPVSTLAWFEIAEGRAGAQSD